MKVFLFPLMVVWVVIASTSADAQLVGGSIYNWRYQHHASTALEGYLNGQANLVEAVGQANYLDSMAALNYQQAFRTWIENGQLYVKTYLDNQDYMKERRERYVRKAPSKEQWARIHAMSLPARLTPQEYEAHTGRLNWPHILRTAEYDALRNRIDELLAARTADNSGNGSPFQQELASLVHGMQILLKNNLGSASPSQYVAAKAFLQSLDYEAKQPLAQGRAADF